MFLPLFNIRMGMPFYQTLLFDIPFIGRHEMCIRDRLNGAALDQHGFKRLDTQTVQGRRAVEHDRMVLDDDFQRVPHFGAHPLHLSLIHI